MSPKTDIFASSVGLSIDRSLWWSDFRFEKLSARLRLWPAIRFNLPLKPNVRFFLGYSSIDPPLQERFNLAGANTLIKERSFWLRSVGAFPENKDGFNNFHVAGDANLRGYYNGVFAFKRVFASNAELELPFPLPINRKLSRMLDRKLFLFYDWGKVMDKRPLEGLRPGALDESTFDNIIADFGVGVSLWKVTAEFPLYLSHPCIVREKREWDFRWTIGFSRLF
jgi:outer membrane protein assembly factor BamA